MAAIEVDGLKLDEDKLMHVKPACACCRRRETRLILPSAPWNTSGRFMLHCFITGRLTPIDVVEVLREQHLLDAVISEG